MRPLFFLCFLFAGIAVNAQGYADTATIKKQVDSVNRLLDRAVVKKDRAVMEKYYAPDFFFLHATGKIDSKASWIKGALNPDNKVLSREHDSVVVELHANVAIVSGILNVRFPPATKKEYAIRYIRVFVFRENRWQLVSHHSTAQWEIKND
jgi:hypothetical protein